MKHTFIIWDFNGTIYDDVGAGYISANCLLGSHGMRRLADIESYREHFRFPIIDYYRSLGFDFSKEPFEQLAVEWVEHYKKASVNSGMVGGVYEALKKFRALGYRQTVISASETAMLKRQLNQLGIIELFDETAGTGDIYAHSKKEIAMGWREIHPGKAVWVGDTVHDFEVASAIDADCVLYSGGHEAENRLVKCGCPVFGDMFNLPEIITNL